MNRPIRHHLSVTLGPRSSPAPQPSPIDAADAALQSGRPDTAEHVLRQADVVGRGDAVGMHLLAIACAQQQRFAEAEAVWRALLALPGQEAQVLPNLGRMLEKAGRLDEARALLARAVELTPQDYTARLNLGACLHALGRYAEARDHTEAAARLRPDLAQPWFNLGSLWQAEDHFAQAARCHDQALSIDPTHQGAISNGLFLQHFLPEVTPADRLRSARERGDALCRGIAPKPHPRTRAPGPLRVGLLSADFRAHSVGWFLAGFLPLLDSAQVRVTAYNNGTRSDALTARLRAACSDWHDIHALGDAAAADLIASYGLDVLLDLSGMTAGHRLGVLARKPAPLQVSWLGYFSSTGMPTIDWVLADPLCVPPGEERFFREQVWRLPHSRFCMAPPPDAPEVNALPALSAGAVTFGCFQELAKLNDRVLRTWAAVLHGLPGARLRVQSARLAKPEERARFALRLEAAGLDPARCALLPPTNRAGYLRAHHEIDFILDSFPYTGGTTTCEALWMGVPTLTLASPGMLERQGEAHLRNVGLVDWVAHSEQDFVQRALSHASPEGLRSLAVLRSQLRERCRVSPLFDNGRFAADWTQALRAMHQQFLSQPLQEP
ncbi:O-linked N-acetylglucosamine transferase family protein [Hydrogenophaga sp. MI9]|uniref:O-linked N-acetylglucosamine transferase, SPINDLY family protein n=1 Tax=Hydrogenophaga sp. MI9 TaxID=3453719 RepID=UPI003EF0610F